VTTGGIGILHGSLAALAKELGVNRSTILKDLRTIHREELRREELAPRLPGLREETGVSRKGRLPKAVVWRLACQYAVTPRDIRNDIAIIDSTSTYPRPPAPPRQPWDLWARLRPRPSHLTRQLTTLFDEETYEKLVATGHPSTIIRQATAAWLDSGTHHGADDCAMAVVQRCAPEVQGRLVRSADRLKLPLVEVLAALLLIGSKREEG
jgi:hypothetical protein